MRHDDRRVLTLSRVIHDVPFSRESDHPGPASCRCSLVHEPGGLRAEKRIERPSGRAEALRLAGPWASDRQTAGILEFAELDSPSQSGAPRRPRRDLDPEEEQRERREIVAGRLTQRHGHPGASGQVEDLHATVFPVKPDLRHRALVAQVTGLGTPGGVVGSVDLVVSVASGRSQQLLAVLDVPGVRPKHRCRGDGVTQYRALDHGAAQIAHRSIERFGRQVMPSSADSHSVRPQFEPFAVSVRIAHRGRV